MPSTATTLGLVLLLAGAAPLPAQSLPPAGPALGQPEIPPAAASGFSLAQIHEATPAERIQQSARPAHPADQFPWAAANGLSGQSLSPPPREPSPEVVPVVCEVPLQPEGRPPAAGGSPPPEKSHAGIPLSPPGRQPPRALSPPGGSHRAEAGKPVGGLPSLLTVAGSLAVVLGIFLFFAWVLRRAAPRGSTLLPGEVVEVLGRAPLAGRQQVHLLRCGNKLLLVSVTPAGAETLTEITDPLEVDRLAGLCQQARPNSATAAFGQVFQQFHRQHSLPELARRQEDEYDDYRLAGAGVGSDGLEEHDV